jgi:hypothetical protein
LTYRNRFINLNKGLSVLTLALIILSITSILAITAPAVKADSFPSIQANPSQGRVGTQISITGSGFTPGGRVGVNLGSASSIVSADGSGGIFTTLNAPNLNAGQYNIQAGDQETGYVAYAAFTILPSVFAITVKPNAGQPGQPVTITGTGFTPGGIVTLTFDSISIGTTTASSSGSINYQATIPASPVGDHTITAKDTQTGSTTATFTMRQGSGPTETPNVTPSGSTTPPPSESPTATPPTSQGTISLTPSQGKIGSTVTVSGYGFTPNSLITINIGGNPVAQPYSDGNGRINGASFTIPATIAVGSYSVSAYDTTTGSSAYQAFAVTSESSSSGGFFSPLVIGIIVAVVVAVLIPLTFVATRRRGGGKSRAAESGPQPGQYPPYAPGQYPPPPQAPMSRQMGQSYGAPQSSYGSPYGSRPSAAGRPGGQRFQCPYCGRPLDAGARVCPRCGKRVERPRAQYSFEGNLGL